MASTSATNPDTLVSLKINQDGANRKFKVPLRDLGANTLPDKLRYLLAIPPTSEAIFERYSDSAAAFVVLDPNNASVYKQLYRAAKAKLKLRLKVTIKDQEQAIPTTKDEPERVLPKPATVEDEEPSAVIEVEQPTYSSPPPSTLNEYVPDHTVNQVRSVAELSRGLEELVLRNSRCSPSATSSKCSSGISQKQSSQSSTEIPVTRGPAAREKWFAEIASVSHLRQNPIRNHTDVPAPTEIFAVHCNNCNDKIPDGHYHCSICDDGDFDLCESCVKDGVVCKGEGHWMIKRFVKNGKVINSTTETVAPKAVPKVAQFSESKVTLVAPEEPEYLDAARTCNSCIQEFPEDKFVTCTTCDDYDLCIPCHVNMEHGHNPKHAFAPAVEDTHLDELAKELLAPGRNTSHNAICDGCDKYVYGVRHKCLDCPDWDFCSTCIVNSSFIHPGHRFVPIYEPLYDMAAVSGYATKARHQGIYCDGPLCNANSGVQSYIKGDRYKCAVCHDTDFCANCEASPSNQHNKTHPLIKFRTPVRLANITTIGEHGDGTAMPVMGDRHRGRTTSKATETTPTASANAATQVQTVADLQPSESKAEDVKPTIKVEEKQEVKPEEVKELPVPAVKEELVAYFVRDAVRDGTTFTPNSVFEQTWYLRNGGNSAWPAGCSVKFTGGDNMCANDPDHPASVHELVSAAESTTCYTEVAPGQEAGFTVLMRTPKQPGNAMSYWRLTGPDGTKFGPRMWCDINVEVPAPIIKEEPIEEPVAERSQMIFPKLEKESPTTSIHEETVEHPETKSQSDLDEFEYFVDEPLDEETDDGFLTDEEYDILDASDEEYLVEQAKAARK